MCSRERKVSKVWNRRVGSSKIKLIFVDTGICVGLGKKFREISDGFKFINQEAKSPAESKCK